MQLAVEQLEQAGESEDISIAALTVSDRSPSISMYGPGSTTAMALLRLGRCIIGGLSAARNHQKLASAARRIRGNFAAASRDASVCDELVELSRHAFRICPKLSTLTHQPS